MHSVSKRGLLFGAISGLAHLHTHGLGAIKHGLDAYEKGKHMKNENKIEQKDECLE